MSKTFNHTLDVRLTAVAALEPFADVPCGSCNACCRLLAPYLTPSEISSGKYPLSFVQGPEGPIVTMFKNPETGGCSQFKDNKCSIYEDRPVACRQFDCRKHWTQFAHKYPQETKALEEKWKNTGSFISGSTESTNATISEATGEQSTMGTSVPQNGCEKPIEEGPMISGGASYKE